MLATERLVEQPLWVKTGRPRYDAHVGFCRLRTFGQSAARAIATAARRGRRLSPRQRGLNLRIDVLCQRDKVFCPKCNGAVAPKPH
jgi:hypothetical protein